MDYHPHNKHIPYVNNVHIYCIQGCVCLLLWVFFFILGPLAMFHMLQCLIWFSLFWICAVVSHVSWLWFLTDPMSGISFLSYPLGSTAGCWGMSNVNFSDPSRVYAVKISDFPDGTNCEWWVQTKLVDPFQSTGDVVTSSASSAQCLQMTCSTRLRAQWGWQNRRGERNKILDSKVRLQTADDLGSTGEWNLQYPELTWPYSYSLMSCWIFILIFLPGLLFFINCSGTIMYDWTAILFWNI
jgi:hypothetical protein